MNATTRIQRMFARLVAMLARAGAGRIPGARWTYALLHRLVFRGEVRQVLANGMPMWLDTRDRVIATHLFGEEVWEPEETKTFLAHVREGMCVFDVGANVGYYTLLAARAVGPSGRVYAFEPEPGNFGLLSRNVLENGFGNARPVQQAVSDRAGVTRLHLDDANFGAHSFEAGSVGTSSGRFVDVETVRLDDFAEEASAFSAGILVKIDVQGAEARVIEGGQTLLGLPRAAVLLEVWPEALARDGRDPLEFLRGLERLGFRFHSAMDRGASPRRLTAEDVISVCGSGPDAQLNLLLTK